MSFNNPKVSVQNNKNTSIALWQIYLLWNSSVQIISSTTYRSPNILTILFYRNAYSQIILNSMYGLAQGEVWTVLEYFKCSKNIPSIQIFPHNNLIISVHKNVYFELYPWFTKCEWNSAFLFVSVNFSHNSCKRNFQIAYPLWNVLFKLMSFHWISLTINMHMYANKEWIVFCAES